MTTVCTGPKLSCQTPEGLSQPRIEADFSGGTLTSNAGALLIGLAEQRLNLFDRLAACFRDTRNPDLAVHSCRSMAGQRIIGLLLGYEDLNDHDGLRSDPALGAVLGCLEPGRSGCQPLAGKSTLNRLELAAAGLNAGKNRKITADFAMMDRLMTDLLIEQHPEPPEEIVLDLDATDFELHGGQERRFYHGYYKEHCYMPLLVFCGRQPVLARLRTASEEPASGVAEELDALVGRIRESWPETRIILRTDSGFCRDPILSWCERTEGVEYVTGLARNPRLQGRIADAMRRSRSRTAVSGKPSRRFRSFCHRTRSSWSRSRRVIAKAEALPEKGGGTKANPRFIVTSLPASTHPGQKLYEEFYCARGDAENRVKEMKTDLFAERCSSNLFGANTLRLYFSAFAHILHNRLAKALSGKKPDKAASGRKLARAMPETLRLRLLKIGARVRVSVRRIHVAMSSSCPDKDIFAAAWRELMPP